MRKHRTTDLQLRDRVRQINLILRRPVTAFVDMDHGRIPQIGHIHLVKLGGGFGLEEIMSKHEATAEVLGKNWDNCALSVREMDQFLAGVTAGLESGIRYQKVNDVPLFKIAG